ncbi:Eco57I restriction-modification methylase domain-containing protein [Paenibacillus bovis]|uniref:site-specific DNA-methyltransferase (adenine-specific) n=1 Tax=Paenibacillus bovis TaxID=1616788 RepID=A0A172ZLT2_9BACL|nr:N-6 DNA methylase [Paenibacillus bovis]ANF98605.1 DNA methyltransferase [Paenibacillus bovis]
MLLKENASIEKLRGGYYTPALLADFIVEWGFVNNPLTVLEPSCGDGNFIESLSKIEADFHCTGIEINEDELEKAKKRLSNSDNFQLINEDFYKFYEDEVNNQNFDLIVGNPPYIRYQYLTEKQRIEQSLILTSSGMKSNKLINAWVSFVVASTHLMSENSRIGLVIPAELLQVAYSEGLRTYLMQNLQRITILTFKELIFPDVEQEVVIFLGEKISDYEGEHQIKLLEYNNINELINNFDNENIAYMNVEYNNSKWTSYFLNVEENALIQQIKNDTRFVQFNNVADVDIGITTGNNNFFCVNFQTVEEYNLFDITRPLIARSVSIRGTYYDEAEWNYNIDRGAKAFLLDFPLKNFEDYLDGHKRYILEGEERKEHVGYKCSIRERWYRVPSIWIPDAFFLRRNYLYPKFVLNEVNAVSTDTMHRIRFKENINPKLAVLAHYNSISLAFTEIEGRSYGGGVLEILPGEVEKLTLPNLFALEIADAQIQEIIDSLETFVRENDDISAFLPELDKKILVDLLNIPEEIIISFRKIWIKLRERRLNRGSKK